MESTFALSNLAFVPPALTMTAPPPSSQPATIKMEDLETNTAHTPGSPGSTCSPEPCASSDQKGGPKKRRSWGQVLPEPKTNLPPRKRAKTADEKEQRRIERVKRNRLAAHNSRERKRQEVEALQDEKQLLEDKLRAIQELAEQQEAQLRYFRTLYPDAVAGAPEFSFSFKGSLDGTLHRNPFESLADLPASRPVLAASSGSPGTAHPPSSANATPDSLAHTLDSFSMPSTPCAENASGADLTQHSAAMLCPDLQCQSVSRRAPSSAMAISNSVQPSPFSRASGMMLCLLLTLLNLTISSASSALISAYLATSRSFPILRTSPSSPPSQLPRACSNRPRKTTASTSPTRVDLSTASLLIRSPALAQQFLLATSLALRQSSSLVTSAPSSGAALPARTQGFGSAGPSDLPWARLMVYEWNGKAARLMAIPRRLGCCRRYKVAIHRPG